MNALSIGLIGLLTGLHAATWGGFKDSPFEGFRPASFVRSIALGLLAALALALFTDLESGQPALLLIVGVCYTGERLATEWWKSIVREDDQTAYSIPMRLAVHGRPIDDRRQRYLLGLAIAVGLLVLCWAIRDLQSVLPDVPVWVTVLLAGTGGWLTAVGGAWKDAPVEGFSGWKFLRSPVVATGWAAVLSPFTHDWVLLAVAAGGWSVISIETYKTFLTGGRPPGKFAEKPVRFDVRDVREACRVVHVGLYGVLAAGLGDGAVARLAARCRGLASRPRRGCRGGVADGNGRWTARARPGSGAFRTVVPELVR